MDREFSEIKGDLENLQDYLKNNKYNNTYFSGKCFYIKDKTFKNFEFCDKILLELNEKIKNEKKKIENNILNKKLEDYNVSNLEKIKKMYEDKIFQQDKLLEKIVEKISEINRV